jgi:hypothetical protein
MPPRRGCRDAVLTGDSHPQQRLTRPRRKTAPLLGHSGAGHDGQVHDAIPARFTDTMGHRHLASLDGLGDGWRGCDTTATHVTPPTPFAEPRGCDIRPAEFPRDVTPRLRRRRQCNAAEAIALRPDSPSDRSRTILRAANRTCFTPLDDPAMPPGRPHANTDRSQSYAGARCFRIPH